MPLARKASNGAAEKQIFGRDPELARLHELVDGLPERGSALLVRGEPGIGKSTLLKAASRRAEKAEMRVLRTTGVQSEARLPFAGLHQLVLPVNDRIEQLPVPQRMALSAAFGETDAAAPDRFLIALAVLELLSDVAERTPLLVVAEDAHWLDQPTAEVLAFVARRVEHEPIGLMIAAREGAESFFDDAGLPEMRLRGLDDTASGALLGAHGRELAPEVKGRLLEQAGGNPLALVELPTLLSGDEVGGFSALPARLPLTERLERAFAAQATELPESSCVFLLVAAADGRGALGEIVAAAATIEGNERASDGLVPAIDAGLVEVDDRRVVFHHPLVHSAIYQSASLLERRTAHAALAGVLADQPDRQVWHRAAALLGPDEGVAAGLEAAAERARSRGAIGSAITTLERAVDKSEDQQLKGRRLLHAAQLAFELGRDEDVRRFLNDAKLLALDAPDRTRLLWLREMLEEHLWSRATRVEASVEHAEQMSREGRPDRALDFLMTAALKCWRFNPRQETRDLVLAAAEALPVAEEDPKLLLVLALADPARRGGEVLERLPSLAADVHAEPEAARLLGTTLTAMGAFDRAAEFLATSIDELRAQGRLGLLARALVSQAWAAVALGTFTVAGPVADEAERLARETRQPRWEAGARLARSTLAGVRGEADVAEALAAQAESALLPTGSSSMLALVQIARGVTALGADRFQDAYEQLRRLFDPADIAFHPGERTWVVLDLVEAAVHSSHRDEARTLVHELETLAAQTRSPVLQVGLGCTRPLLAEHDAAEAEFENALAADLSSWPFARARLQLAYGTWLRRQRRVADSRTPLRAAREAFDALGAQPWAERARRELRSAGVQTSAPASNPLHELTSQELQIARMAASGLSNREIGEQLYLSHRTVGTHLYHVFPKLGIASRGQLRNALGIASY